MTEARVECTCVSYNIPELGLSLKRGEVVWLKAEVARESAELALAKRAGAVSVRWEERCTVSRSPVPPFLKRRGQVPPFAKTTPPPPQVDHQEVANRTAEALRNIVREEVQSAVAGLGGSKVDADAIGEAVRKALAGAPRGSSAVPEKIVQDDPLLYIPERLTVTDAKSAIRVETETTGSSTVDDTAAALKAARAGNRKKKEA